MSQTTEIIKERLNIVEVVGQYVRLEKAGNHWKACCPFHQEKTPSFTVSEERNMWHCFGCGKGGDVFAFLMEIEGIEFREALVTLAERAGVELPSYTGQSAQPEHKHRSLEVLELATKFYEKQLWESEKGKKMLAYLRGRGLTDETLTLFRIGYAPDGWRFVLDFLLKRGFALAEIEQAGLIIKRNQESGIRNQEPSQHSTSNIQHSHYYDRFRDRIMFPIGDILGRPIGYSARVAPGADETQAKYINTPETDVYHKSRVLYGIHLAKKGMKERGRAILVEGNVDVMALHQAGLTETVAVSGTALTAEQLTIIKRYVGKVILFFDMDGAGQKAAWKSTVLAQELGLLVDMIQLDEGKDAADMGRDHPAALKEITTTSQPAMEHFLDKLTRLHSPNTPEGKRAIVTTYTELIGSLIDPLERAHWIKSVAERIGSEPKLLRASVEQGLQALRRSGQPSDGRASLSPVAPESFETRSEMLRSALIGLMLVDPEVRQAILTQLTAPAHAFLVEHQLFFFLQNETEDVIGTIEDEALQKEASRLLFQALALPTLASLTDESLRIDQAKIIALDYLSLLPGALLVDKQRKMVIAIEAARQAGDKDKERELLEQFAKEAASR